MRKYHNAILYMKGIDNDLHGTPAYLQAVSVDPNSKVKISEDLEKQCIKANIAIYNNLAACLLASSPAGNVKQNSNFFFLCEIKAKFGKLYVFT